MQRKSNAGEFMRMWKLSVLLSAVLCLTGCSQNASTATRDTNPGTTSSRPANGESSNGQTTARDAQVGQDTTTRRVISAGQDNSNLLLGNPSRARSIPDNFLVERPQHAMSYNRSNGGPNWVSWRLEKSDLGTVRRGDFLPDPLLPSDMQIRPSDYRGSGYDRGHVCPSGDRTRSREDNTATFVMSNMLPQAAALNQQVWADLENYSRSLVRSGANELYTIAGGWGSAERIANGKVNVPSVCWKIILVLPQGKNDLQRINADTRVIAVSMPNRERQEIADSKWSQWITSVAQLEKTTGYDFLSALPDSIERALEQKVDSGRAGVAARPRNPEVSRIASRSAVTQSEFQSRTVSTVPTIERSAPQVVERSVTAPSTAVEPAAATQVWVNKKSGVYHHPGARWYGNTKEGAYMSEPQAVAQGYRAAQNGQ
jgi:endonuclease G